MKAVVQRVTRASVTVGGEQISAIGRGICVLLGISMEDSQKELEHMVRKILNLRVFEDESGKHWSKSVMDKEYEVLCVSQFTLQCVLKGNKPDFHLAMPTEQAESFYNSFLEQLRKSYRPELVRDGKFGAYMQVHIQNDGPVTIELESPAPGAANSDPKQLSKLEKQQQRKEKTRAKGPSESSKERNAPRKEDRSASSGLRAMCLRSASHRCRSGSSANYHWAEPDPEKFKMLSPYTALRIQDSNVKRKSEIRHWEPEYPRRKTPKDHPISCNAEV